MNEDEAADKPSGGRVELWPFAPPQTHRLTAVQGLRYGPKLNPAVLSTLLGKPREIGNQVGQFFMVATGSVLHDCWHV